MRLNLWDRSSKAERNRGVTQDMGIDPFKKDLKWDRCELEPGGSIDPNLPAQVILLYFLVKVTSLNTDGFSGLRNIAIVLI